MKNRFKSHSYQTTVNNMIEERGLPFNIHNIRVHPGITQVQTKNTLLGEIISLTYDGFLCQGALVTACAVLWRRRNCRIIIIIIIIINIRVMHHTCSSPTQMASSRHR